MSAAIATALKKIAIYILTNAKARKGALVAVGSIIAGFLGLMFLPVAVLSGMGEVNVDDTKAGANLTQQAFLDTLTPEQKQELQTYEDTGTAIENAMAEQGVKAQTVKAQIIYLTYFEDVDTSSETFFSDYAYLFANSYNDDVLLQAINTNYGLNIDYNEFMKSYTMIMNLSINKYMFEDSSTKNNSDLAAWAENAFISGWGYKTGSVGEITPELKYRSCDNAGLVLGYLNYNPETKEFENDTQMLVYNIEGSIEELPETVGVGLFDGQNFAVYIGNGEAVYCTQQPGYVTRELVSQHNWTDWVTFEGVSYPDSENSTESSQT